MSELDNFERRVPRTAASGVKYNARAIDFRVSIMPSIHGEDAVLRVLDKESMSEKSKKLTLEVVGSTKTTCAASGATQGNVRHGAGHRADGQRKNDDSLRAVNEIKTDEDKIIT